jgi:hypothetical protein
MSTEADAIRREMIATGQPARDLEQAKDTWTMAGLQRDFDVLGFAAPFVVVRRKSDGAVGSVEFTHSPRTYFGWKPDAEAGQ